VTHSVDEAVTPGHRILVFARPGRMARTVTVPADRDGPGRAAVRADVMRALEDARACSEAA